MCENSSRWIIVKLTSSFLLSVFFFLPNSNPLISKWLILSVDRNWALTFDEGDKIQRGHKNVKCTTLWWLKLDWNGQKSNNLVFMVFTTMIHFHQKTQTKSKSGANIYTGCVFDCVLLYSKAGLVNLKVILVIFVMWMWTVEIPSADNHSQTTLWVMHQEQHPLITSELEFVRHRTTGQDCREKQASAWQSCSFLPLFSFLLPLSWEREQITAVFFPSSSSLSSLLLLFINYSFMLLSPSFFLSILY